MKIVAMQSSKDVTTISSFPRFGGFVKFGVTPGGGGNAGKSEESDVCSGVGCDIVVDAMIYGKMYPWSDLKWEN